jgi:acylpyruvate hydrolase
MKLVTFDYGKGDRLGALTDGQVVDLNAAHALYLEAHGEGDPRVEADRILPSDMVSFLGLGEPALTEARKALDYVSASGPQGQPSQEQSSPVVYPQSDVKLRSPITRPPKVICIGLNYVDHCEETGVPVPDSPFFFLKPWTAITGPYDPIVIPKMAQVNDHVDYEIELAAVIGKGGRHITEEEAYGHVAGYAVLNDVSARDFVPPEFIPMKGFDSFAPMGPCITTSDEIGDPDDLDIQLRVNGEVRQNSNTRNFVFNVAQIVSYLSQIVTLEPGDIISTGTPGGVGWRRDPPAWLHPGDVVEVEIQNIGVLRNTVVKEA